MSAVYIDAYCTADCENTKRWLRFARSALYAVNGRVYSMSTTSRRTVVSSSRKVCELHLEGIVAKRKTAAYKGTEKLSVYWVKIKNPKYWQARSRDELFNPSLTESLKCDHREINLQSVRQSSTTASTVGFLTRQYTTKVTNRNRQTPMRAVMGVEERRCRSGHDKSEKPGRLR